MSSRTNFWHPAILPFEKEPLFTHSLPSATHTDSQTLTYGSTWTLGAWRRCAASHTQGVCPLECWQSREAERGLLGNNGQDICHAWLHSPPLTMEQGEWLVVLFFFGLSFPGTALCSTMVLLSPPCFCQRLTLQTFFCLPFFFLCSKIKQNARNSPSSATSHYHICHTHTHIYACEYQHHIAKLLSISQLISQVTRSLRSPRYCHTLF